MLLNWRSVTEELLANVVFRERVSGGFEFSNAFGPPRALISRYAAVVQIPSLIGELRLVLNSKTAG